MKDLKNIPTDQLIKELMGRDNAFQEYLSTAVLLLQKFCDDFCLHDEKIDAALEQLAKRTEQVE
ncbi:MAG: hypothetical protein ACI4J3_00775 [Oscillospiraceae bacterium]